MSGKREGQARGCLLAMLACIAIDLAALWAITSLVAWAVG